MTEKTSKAEKGPLCFLSSQEPLTVMVRVHQRMPTGMVLARLSLSYCIFHAPISLYNDINMCEGVEYV